MNLIATSLARKKSVRTMIKAVGPALAMLSQVLIRVIAKDVIEFLY